MKKTFTFLIAVLISLIGLKAQNIIFEDDFESSNFPSGYTLHDEDGNTVNTNIAQFFQDPWSHLNFQGDPNMFIASTSMYTPAGTSDDWVITSALNLTTDNYLFFKTRSGSANSKDDFEVRISTSTNDLDSFQTVLLTVTEENTAWTLHQVKLDSYDNETVYIAWRNTTYDGYILALDDILVTEVLNGDSRMEEITVSDKVKEGSSVNVTGTFAHVGSDTLNSIDVNWSIDGGTVKTHSISGLNLTYGQTYSFTHDSVFTPTNAGAFSDLTVWVSNPNGNMDANTSNDTISKGIFVVLGNDTNQRKVLFEEFTTAGCVWCPDGHVVMANILAQNSNVIPVSVHSCFGTDSMTNADASTLCSTLGVNAAPTAMVDRFQHPGDDKPAHSRTVWQDRVNARSQIGSSAAIDLSGIYSWNRKVTLDVSVSFSDYELPGDIRLSLIVIEDSVSGTGSGWDQRNNLNTVSGHPMFGRGNPIVGYQHRHVLRKILPSTWGDNSVIPSNVVPNVSYDHTFVYNIPNKFKSKDMSFVAVVSYKGNASDEYEVINAKEIKMSELVVSSVSENSIEKSSFGFYPNPSADVSMIELELLENNNVEANLFDVTGKVVLSKNYLELQKGMNYLPIDVSSLANGFYFLKVKVGDEYLTKKVVVSHE